MLMQKADCTARKAAGCCEILKGGGCREEMAVLDRIDQRSGAAEAHCRNLRWAQLQAGLQTPCQQRKLDTGRVCTRILLPGESVTEHLCAGKNGCSPGSGSGQNHGLCIVPPRPERGWCTHSQVTSLPSLCF